LLIEKLENSSLITYFSALSLDSPLFFDPNFSYMASINLYLRPEMTDSEGKTPIYLVFQERGKKFKHYTGRKIKSGNWNSRKQRAIDDSPGVDEVNREIGFQEKFLKELYYDFSSNHDEIDFSDLKAQFKSSLFKAREENEFFCGFQEFITESRKEKKASTVLIYEALLRDVKSFSKFFKQQIAFSKINGGLLREFSVYLATENSNTNNTINKKVKTLKVYLKWASEKGFIKEGNYRNFNVKSTAAVKVFLSEAELSLFFNLNIARYPDLTISRDLFLFSCFTGLKFSDIIGLKPQQIVNGKMIIFHANLNETVSIPLNNYGLMILKKYEELNLSTCFPTISNVQINRDVKELGKMACLLDPVEVKIAKGDALEIKTVPKYNLLSTNSARLTYAIQSIKDGMPPQLIGKILGQKNIDNLLKIALQTTRPADVEIVNSWNIKVF
jgi:site-specific recombinase XerD